MTDTQLEHYKRAHRYYGIHTDLTPEEKEVHKRISCIEMINSIIAYHGLEMDYILSNRYMADHLEELGLLTVMELAQAQIDEVAYIKHDVFTDSEGCSYNSIVWKDMINEK